MNFTPSDKQTHWRDRVVAFMNECVYPAVAVYEQQMKDFGTQRWQAVPVLEELKAKAQTAGLWNLFLPDDSLPAHSPLRGAGLNNLEYAPCAEEMGKLAIVMDKVGSKVAQQEIGMIKVAAPRIALRVIDMAIQAFGGAGVAADAGLAKLYAGQRSLRLADGPDEVHNRSIAKLECRRHRAKA